MSAGKPFDKNLPNLFNNLAWLRATCPDQSLRESGEALSLARRACELSDWGEANKIDTLAAAYAETGDFLEGGCFSIGRHVDEGGDRRSPRRDGGWLCIVEASPTEKRSERRKSYCRLVLIAVTSSEGSFFELPLPSWDAMTPG